MTAPTTGPARPTKQPFTRPKRELPFPLSLYQTAIGKKWVMALTGIMLLGFVLFHMIGNLHLYEGPIQVNEYGEALRDLGGHLIPRTFLLWVMRLGLMGAFALHIHSAYSLTRINMAARPKDYESKRDYIAADFASRTMRWTGIIVGLFIIWHLADLTWGWTTEDWIRGDVYNNVVVSLSRPPVALLYVLANIALAIHLFHGIFSMFQSLGINSPKFNGARRALAIGFSGLILIGNLSFPVMTQMGVIDADGPTEMHETIDGEEG